MCSTQLGQLLVLNITFYWAIQVHQICEILHHFFAHQIRGRACCAVSRAPYHAFHEVLPLVAPNTSGINPASFLSDVQQHMEFRGKVVRKISLVERPVTKPVIVQKKSLDQVCHRYRDKLEHRHGE